MTTRKALIERIQSMQLGTQEMLDEAADDATRIPFNTLFITKDTGDVVWRLKAAIDDKNSVHITGVGCRNFCEANDLRPMSEN